LKPEPFNLKLCTLASCLLALGLGCGKSDSDWPRGMLPPAPPTLTYHIGSPVSGLRLTDTARTTHSIEAYRGRIVVLEFWSCRSPYVEKSEKARQRLIARYGPQDMAYLAIDSNRDEYRGEIEQYLGDHRSSYPVVADDHGMVARRFNAKRTPQVVVLDRGGVVRYIGGLCSDDEWAKSEVERADWLEPALDALLAGRSPDPSTRPPKGNKIRMLPSP